jgi:hypothetical protein
MGPWCYGILLDQPTRSPAAFAVTSLEGCSPLQPRSPWGDLNFAWALLWPHGAKGLAALQGIDRQWLLAPATFRSPRLPSPLRLS